MPSHQDPFERSPKFMRRFRPIDRLWLQLALPVGAIAATAVFVQLVIPVGDPVGRGLCVSIILLAKALLLSFVLMLTSSWLGRPRQFLVDYGSILSNAALSAVLSLAELLALAFLRAANSDPLAGTIGRSFAVLIAAFIMTGALGLVFIAAHKTYSLPGHAAPLALCASAALSLTLYFVGITALVVVTVMAFSASAAIIVRATKNFGPPT